MVTGTKQENLANTSYADRQLVVVLPDEVVEAARKAEAAAKTSKKSVDWPDIAVAVSRSLAGGLVSAVVELTAEALAAWASARERGLNIRQVGKSEVSQLVFPPGHPRTGVLYVGHPAMPNVYFTVASFHRVAFEHKFAEAVDLLMHLGASEIRVEHVRGWSREFAGRLSVPLPAKKNALSAESKRTEASSLLFEATLKGSATPTLPNQLVWYPHEPTWQSIAKGRTGFGLQQFSLAVNYEDDFGINAGLKVSALKSGLDLGGSFEDHQATTWKLHGKFAGG